MEKTIKVFVDGATVGNNGKLGTVKEVGIGVYIQGDGRRFNRVEAGMSNNEAEFKALIWAMELCIESGYKDVEFLSDSIIIVNRANGSRPKKKKFRNERMDAFQDTVVALKEKFNKVSFKWIPREQNFVADKLSKRAVMELLYC